MTYAILFIVVMWLAYGNGANDNFKGVATLYGSGAATFRTALAWASVATLAGSLVSVFFAERLVSVFSGLGLLSDELIGSGDVLVTVAAAAGATIMIATLIGMPTSTTHALAGALIGIAWTTSSLVNPGATFVKLFALPLLLSPLLAMALAIFGYPLARRLQKAAQGNQDACICLEPLPAEIIISTGPAYASTIADRFRIGTIDTCNERQNKSVLGFRAATSINTAHYLSAGAVCFSRAVNDTPKVAALLIALSVHDPNVALMCVALAMTAGGLIQSRRVAETMSRRITELDPIHGLWANLVTAGLVLGASRMGVPVSTTHVSCGAIFGIGAMQRQARWKMIAAIGLTWLTTLPLAAVLSVILYRTLMIAG